MPVLEREWEVEFVSFCHELGIMCEKLKPFTKNAWPDRTLLYRGNVMFVELKKDGEKPTPLQHYVMGLLSLQGFFAIWADNLVEAKQLVTLWKNHVDKYSASTRIPLA